MRDKRRRIVSLAGGCINHREPGLNDIAVLIFILNRYYSVIFRTIKNQTRTASDTPCAREGKTAASRSQKMMYHMFNLRGIAGDSPFSIQQEAELMIGHVISHGCLNGTFGSASPDFTIFTVNGMVAAPEEISTSEPSSLFFITLPASSKRATATPVAGSSVDWFLK